MSETQADLMTKAIGAWLQRLESYPGWKDWKRRHLAHTLHFDDKYSPSIDRSEGEFKFSNVTEREHAVISRYLGLQETIRSLKECEFYFRGYPFRGLPVTRHSHITNVCEMFFGRFYKFKERLKSYFDALKEAVPNHNLEVGSFIKLFERTFDQELRTRNFIHHQSRFEDVAIDRILLTDAISTGRSIVVGGVSIRMRIENLRESGRSVSYDAVNKWTNFWRRDRTDGASVQKKPTTAAGGLPSARSVGRSTPIFP